MKKTLNILKYILIIIVSLLLIIIILVNFTPVQNFIARQATSILSKQLNTTVKLDYISIDPFRQVSFKGLYIEDQTKDTLLYAGNANVQISIWQLVKEQKAVLDFVGLDDAYVNLYRNANSDQWNYQFIIDAFDTGKKDTTKNKAFEVDLDAVELERIRFFMNDRWVGSDMNFDIGRFDIEADKIDLDKKKILLDEIIAENTKVIFRDYDGGRPPVVDTVTIDTIDTTPFNPAMWEIELDEMALKNCLFSFDSGNEPALVKEFDPEHIHVDNINIDIEDVKIIGDTLTAKLNNLSAKERCGLIVKQFTADVTVSPNESTCKDLLLETTNSKISDLYSMQYNRFPNFNDYIDSVKMVAHFKGATIDSRDIAYFAPTLREYPTIIDVSGKFNGAVNNITAKNLYITDGISTVKGNLKIKGLPDIESTFFDYSNGELYTNGTGIFRYAPSLKNDSTIAFEQIKHAHFKGDFKGYLDNFTLNGAINTNLGSIVSNVELEIPNTKEQVPIYYGDVTVKELNLGTLLRQTDLGTVTLEANLDGQASNLENADLKFDAFIEQLEYKNYPYQGINADGKLEHKKFIGNLIINDPNIALGFYGEFDFSDSLLNINAKANLLHSDLTTLNLVKEDSVTLSADFDLDWEGNTIDNFNGTARLYNIDLHRNSRRLDIDSVYVNMIEEGNNKKLTLNSNPLTARLQGQYELSTLPSSFQYYISGYLPNYIQAPSGKIHSQNITFGITTKELDSLFGIFAPSLSGFNNAKIGGHLNTNQQELQLDANIPQGKIDNITLDSVKLSATGNFNTLGVNVDVGKVIFPDSAINGSISITTTLGNDNLDFNIATLSPNQVGTVNVKGKVHAHGDTLDMSFAPSEFYVNTDKWVIPAGNKIVYTDDYLAINNLAITSGNRSIRINSDNKKLEQQINIAINNLNISNIAVLAGITEYDPQGRINGEVQIKDLFNNIMVMADVKAQGVKFGKDTLGRITINGSYDGKKHLVNLDKSTGIFNGSNSLKVFGKISFDSTNTENIDGKIVMENTQLAWLAPILNGYVSELEGNLNGNITLKGTSTYPDINGQISLRKANLHIDFLGTVYKIPEAAFYVNNKEIGIGKITLYDRHDNQGNLSGSIYHNRFKNMRLDLSMSSDKLEVINLKRNESDLFYGNLIAGIGNLSVTGPVDDVTINIARARPVEKSQLYLPISSEENTVGAYSYITFKSEEEEKEVVKKSSSKLNIQMNVIANPMAEITLIMDPTTGDAISAKGSGNISIDIPADNDIKMYGNYVIEEGDYVFTLKQLFFKRKFALNSGSQIQFSGPIFNTQLDVEGVYRTRARLYDLLTKQERDQLSFVGKRDSIIAYEKRDVDVLLFMNGTLGAPDLSFKIEVPDKSITGSVAYTKLQLINQNERELFNQVASLLLINSFLTPEGNFGGGASAGVVNNISDIFSGTASTQLTNLISRLTGDDDLAVNFKYQQYNYNTGIIAANRNAVSLGLRKNLFRDRLTIEVGSSLDWGKPTSTNSASNFTPVGDFRLQYLFKEGGNLRGNIFRSSSYDVLADQNISRGGVGLSWRRSFDNLQELFGNKVKEQPLPAVDTAEVKN